MEYFCNVLLTTVAFYLFFYIGAMGAGDVKLLLSVQDIFPVKKFSVFYFSRCYSQQFLHFAKCTWARNLWDRLCYLGEYVWDVVRCGRWKAYLQRREHIREAESVWPVPCFAVCCYT